jgi:acyl carrier protein
MFTREQIEKAVLDAAAEAFGKDVSEISLSMKYKADLDATSVKVMKAIMFIGENLDLDDDIEYEDVAKNETLAETVDVLVQKLG